MTFAVGCVLFLPQRECDVDADCAAGEVCVGGQCRQDVACIDAVDCDDNNACTTDTCTNNNCSSADIRCVTVSDCPAGCNASCTNLVCR